MTVIKCISELEIGKVASGNVTEEYYRALLKKILENGIGAIYLSHDFFDKKQNVQCLKKISLSQDLSDKDFLDFFKRVRKGFSTIFVMPNCKIALNIFKSHGYEDSKVYNIGNTQEIFRDEGNWLERIISDGQCGLVVGHDYEPVYIFEPLK